MFREESLKQYHNIQGFTLIEISIVLVVIALLSGGVLVGRDLIKAAQVRATLRQVDSYSQAVNVFKLKYMGLPGDLLPAHAISYGFANRSGTIGQGDGDGFLEGGMANSAEPCGETVLFWNDLSTANLVDGRFTGVDGSPSGGTCMNSSNLSDMLPISKLSGNTYFLVYATGGGGTVRDYNYFQLIGATSMGGANMGGCSHSITPTQSYAIDSKIDDGMPLTGTVQSVGATQCWVTTPPTAGTAGCSVVISLIYATRTTPNDPVCSLRIRM